jgi:hypothetical protein
MERPENITLFPLPDDYGSIYDFFCECQQNSTIVTIPMIRDRFFHGNYDAAYIQVQRYWRWFLVCVDNKGQTHKYRVVDLDLYPRSYFVEAHKPQRMRFFHHFVENKKAYDERDRVQRTRKNRPEYRTLTLVGIGEQLDEQQPMPEIVIHTDDGLEENGNGQPISEDDIIKNASREEPLPPEDTATISSLNEPLPPSSSVRLIAWVVLGSIVVIVLVSLVYLLFNRQE